jgi:hypothetical protein
MSGYDRLVLVLDEPSAGLGSGALTLVELGVDVVYTKNVDEAVLLGRQEAGRMGAGVFSVPEDPDAAEEVARRLLRVLDCPPTALLPVGFRPPAPVVERLREVGVRWCLWRPWTDRQLLLAATLALHAGNPSELRKECRVPVEIEAVLIVGEERREVTVWNLTAGGAYLEAEQPVAEGLRVGIEIPLGQIDVEGEALVSHVVKAERPGWLDRPVGIGIHFAGISPASELGLAIFLDEKLRSFRLEVARD